MLKTKGGLAINDKQNYEYIVETLRQNHSMVVSWTDQNSVHFDIVFVYRPAFDPAQIGILQGGIKHNYLFVSIIKLGSFAFEAGRSSGHNYYTEKLSVPFNVGYELAEFINGVRTLL